jgi:hypothetical protein
MSATPNQIEPKPAHRPTLPNLQVHGGLHTRLRIAQHRYFVFPLQLFRGLFAPEEYSIPSFGRLITNQAKATPKSLHAVAVLGHCIGAKSDEILVSHVVPAPPAELLIERLERLAATTQTTLCALFVQERIAEIRASLPNTRGQL